MRVLHHAVLLSTMLWILFATNIEFLIVVISQRITDEGSLPVPCVCNILLIPSVFFHLYQLAC